MKPKIHIILGSTRTGRFGDKIAGWIYAEALKRNDFDAELIDLREWDLPFFDEAVSPSYNGGTYSLPLAQKWAEKVAEADGYIFVTPEYNHSFPAVLKNAIDYVYKEWNNKPGGVVTYSVGPWGGVRAAQQLRQVMIELQMVPIRNGVHLGFVTQKFNESGEMIDEQSSKLTGGFFDQLIWWAQALKSARG